MQIANLTANFNVGKCIFTVKFQRDENAELGFSLLEHTNIDCIPNIYIEMINHVIEFIFTSPLVETACNDLNLAHVDYNNNPIQRRLYAMKDIMKVTNLTMALDSDMGTIDLEFDAKKGYFVSVNSDPDYLSKAYKEDAEYISNFIFKALS